MTVRRVAKACAWLGLTAVVACGRMSQPHATPKVASIIEEAEAPGPGPTVSSAPFLKNRRLVDVEALPIATDGAPFQLLSRETQLQKAPCANCHTQPLEQLQRARPKGKALAHWAVTMQHAAAPVMSCATCHQRDSPTLLHTLSGQTVAIDHAYQMCAQCHATQAADWAGGAHGKRAGGWAPPRVRYNCTECHNPHRPKFESRWPAGPGRTQTP